MVTPPSTGDLYTEPCIKSSASPSLCSSIGCKEGCVAAKRPKYNNIMTLYNDNNEEGADSGDWTFPFIVAFGSGMVKLGYP